MCCVNYWTLILETRYQYPFMTASETMTAQYHMSDKEVAVKQVSVTTIPESTQHRVRELKSQLF
eukprot:1019069-Amphidinium_carterae.1